MKQIDRNIVMLGWVSYFTDLASAMVIPVLPIFVVTVLHEGMDKLGIIVAAATFVSYALRLVSGYMADRYGIVKPLVVSGYFFSAVSKPLLGLAHGWGSVAGLRAMERMGKALRTAPKDLMIAAYSKEKAHGKSFGFHKTLDIAGEFSGTLLLFGLLWYCGDDETVMRTIFAATLLPGLIGLVIVTVLVRDIPKPQTHATRLILSAADKKTVGQLLFYFLFIFFVFGEAFFTMQAKTIGIATAVIPLLFAVSAGVQTLSSYMLGLGSDRFGSGAVSAFGYLCGIIAQGLLWLQTPAATWAAFAFLGFFTVATLNANRAMIAERADNRGSVYGIFYAGVAMFTAAGAMLGGWIWERFGMAMALDVAVAGTIGVSILYGLKKAARR